MAFPTRDLCGTAPWCALGTDPQSRISGDGHQNGPAAEAMLESKIVSGAAAKTEARRECQSASAASLVCKATLVLEFCGVGTLGGWGGCGGFWGVLEVSSEVLHFVWPSHPCVFDKTGRTGMWPPSASFIARGHLIHLGVDLVFERRASTLVRRLLRHVAQPARFFKY